MCLFGETGKVLVKKHATEDIIVYKVMHSVSTKNTDKKKFLTGSLYIPVTLDEIEGKIPFHDPIKHELADTLATLGEGCIHTFAHLEDAKAFMHKHSGTFEYHPAIFKVIIPKGTCYYKGITFDGKDSYASTAIIFKEQLVCRIKNRDYEYSAFKKEEEKQNMNKKEVEKAPFE